jgi:hypothetical protein
VGSAGIDVNHVRSIINWTWGNNACIIGSVASSAVYSQTGTGWSNSYWNWWKETSCTSHYTRTDADFSNPYFCIPATYTHYSNVWIRGGYQGGYGGNLDSTSATGGCTYLLHFTSQAVKEYYAFRCLPVVRVGTQSRSGRDRTSRAQTTTRSKLDSGAGCGSRSQRPRALHLRARRFRAHLEQWNRGLSDSCSRRAGWLPLRDSYVVGGPRSARRSSHRLVIDGGAVVDTKHVLACAATRGAAGVDIGRPETVGTRRDALRTDFQQLTRGRRPPPRRFDSVSSSIGGSECLTP